MSAGGGLAGLAFMQSPAPRCASCSRQSRCQRFDNSHLAHACAPAGVWDALGGVDQADGAVEEFVVGLGVSCVDSVVDGRGLTGLGGHGRFVGLDDGRIGRRRWLMGVGS